MDNMALRRRLLQDIAELQSDPYPNITYVVDEADILHACLILTPGKGHPLHMTINNNKNYPLLPPRIRMDSSVVHPNVMGGYICASILNTVEGYTPAYTLKGIAIQLLSFFSSDRIEQSYGGEEINLTEYRNQHSFRRSDMLYTCTKCHFNGTWRHDVLPGGPEADIELKNLSPNAKKNYKKRVSKKQKAALRTTGDTCHSPSTIGQDDMSKDSLLTMPDEIVVLICNKLKAEDLLAFARAWNRVGSQSGILTKFNLLRNRELTCFVLKQTFETLRLGTGVRIAWHGRQGTLESDFDLISHDAFHNHNVRRSVLGSTFEYWLPLPISRRHYASVQNAVQPALEQIAVNANLVNARPVDVVMRFMNDIVVKLSTETNDSRYEMNIFHASEKAIESYYHLFHLLLCLAVEDDSIVRTIDRTLQGVLAGHSSKTEIPNLGQLLIAVLISNADMTTDLLQAIIRETVTRNVVWMLDRKGQGMAELSYMEADSISHYRLQKTFEASKTSYRLLMFLNLFRRTINRGEGKDRKSLLQLRDALFDSHAAPPHGIAAKLAADVRDLQEVNSFPQFLTIMGLKSPTASTFTTFLRSCMEDSVRKGYSVWGISQERALTLRTQKNPNVQVRTDPKPEWNARHGFESSFFPNRHARGGHHGVAGGSGRGGARRGGRRGG